MQPTYCLKHLYTQGNLISECPEKNYNNYVGICVKNCEADYIFSGGMCTKKCLKDQIDCGAFCGSTSCNHSDLITKDSYIPIYKTSKEEDVTCHKKFYKNSILCVRDCNYYGLENCDFGTCASTKEFCNSKLPETSRDFEQYIVNYLGYIFSLKSNTTFSYSDPISFEATVDELVKYSTNFYERIRQTSKNMQKLLNDGDINYWFLRSIKWGLIHQFSIYPEKEINKLINICQSVAKEWLKMADEKGKAFDFNTLKNPFEMVDWNVCEKFNVKSRQICISNIIKFVKRIGANDLPGITAEFLVPNCRLY